MNNTQLAQKFKWEFGMDRRHATILQVIIIAIIKVGTVNLTKLVSWFNTKTKRESRYKKVKRFFRRYRFDEETLALFLASFAWDWPWILSMDRTNRKYGKTNINILMIGIVYKWIAIPVLRRLLSKRWNSHTTERIEILRRFIEIFGHEKVWLLLADREFIWTIRIWWLRDNNIDFILRIRNNTQVEGYGNIRPIYHSFKHDKYYHYRTLHCSRMIWWMKLYITGMKIAHNEYLIVISDKYREDAIQEYGARREIETLFWCFKTRGFRFEDTHLQNSERIGTMIWVLCIAFVWAYSVWEWRSEKDPIEIKKHWRKQYSIFRYGLDLLRDIFEDILFNMQEFMRALRLLYRT